MDLYMSPMSSSFVVHVACLEAGIPVALQQVARRSKQVPDGRLYREIAPKGLVPALGLPDGTLLTEAAVLLQYIADQAPEKQLAPALGTRARYELMEWLNFITTELHKQHLAIILSSKTPEEAKAWARSSIATPLAVVEASLEGRDYLLGDHLTVADIYLHWIALVAPQAGVSLDPWPNLARFAKKIGGRASVQTALAIEYPRYSAEIAALGQRAPGAATGAASPSAERSQGTIATR